ncbi:MAG: oxidoreductase [Mycobacterium sp.]|nr:oxidoreductase [Mycobacterium sp.]
MSQTSLGVVLPYWLDRPDSEALDIAEQARSRGFSRLWIGEMVTFDAFALATAIGLKSPGLDITIGPVAIGVRSPVALALGVSSVATLTGRAVDLALGASSPAIVSGWHDRDWAAAPTRMRETVEVLRRALDGERTDYAGKLVRTRGFRLRVPQPSTRLTVAAFGPQMTRVAVQSADQLVLNLVSPGHVAAVRASIDAIAAEHGIAAPRLAVWVCAAVDPGPATYRQMTGQIAAYLKPPSYGEMFADLGFGDLVARARAGASRTELADAIPPRLPAAVGAIGSTSEVIARIESYFEAGADHVGIVPATAEDPAGQRVLSAVSARG